MGRYFEEKQRNIKKEIDRISDKDFPRKEKLKGKLELIEEIIDENKAKNDRAINWSLGFIFGAYTLILFMILLANPKISSIILVLIPIALIEFTKAIYENLANENEKSKYEAGRNLVHLVATGASSILVSIYLFYVAVDIFDRDSLGTPVEFIIIVVLISLIIKYWIVTERKTF